MTHTMPTFRGPSCIGRRGFLGMMALPIAFPSVLSGCAMAKEVGPPQVPHVTPEMFGWTPETDPVETASIINIALAQAVERGVPFFDNAVRRVAGTIRLGGKVVMEFGTKHRWIADYSNLSRFAVVEENLASGVTVDPRHVFVDTANARGSILRGPMRLTGARISDMTTASRRAIPSSLVALTASNANPSAEVSIESLMIEGFGFGFYQGSQREPGRNLLPYTRLRVGTAVFRFCGMAIETGEWGNGLDDATFDILRISRCGDAALLRGTDLNAASLFYYGLRPAEDAEAGTVNLQSGSNVAILRGFAAEPGMVLAVHPGRDRPGFVAEIEQLDGDRAILSHRATQDYSGAFLIDPPSLIAQNTAINVLHYYIEGMHDLPLALRSRSKATIQDLKISRGSFGARGGAPVSVMGRQVSVDLNLNPRSVENPMVAGMVGLLTANAEVAGRIVSGARLGAENAAVLDTRPINVGRGRPSSAIQGYYVDTAGTLPIVEM